MRRHQSTVTLGIDVREAVPCRCRPNCPHSFSVKLLEAKQKRGEPSVVCSMTAGTRSRSLQLLTGIVPAAPFPAQAREQ
ncbi:MAG: hypothetical protein R2762_28660 [Bryobacteraceae bacterium]